MTPPYLTGSEIAEITEPLTQGAARIRFFQKLGCKVTQKPNGQPLVVRAEFEAAMMGRRQMAQARTDPSSAGIDWKALDERQKRPRMAVVR